MFPGRFVLELKPVLFPELHCVGLNSELTNRPRHIRRKIKHLFGKYRNIISSTRRKVGNRAYDRDVEVWALFKYSLGRGYGTTF